MPAPGIAGKGNDAPIAIDDGVRTIVRLVTDFQSTPGIALLSPKRSVSQHCGPLAQLSCLSPTARKHSPTVIVAGYALLCGISSAAKSCCRAKACVARDRKGVLSARHRDAYRRRSPTVHFR